MPSIRISPKYFPYEDLVIYEIGAGNGTLPIDILDFIRSAYSEAYERTLYNIVEISGRLAKQRYRKNSLFLGIPVSE